MANDRDIVPEFKGYSSRLCYYLNPRFSPGLLTILLAIYNAVHRAYTLTDDEKAKYAGKLLDKHIVIGVRELVPFGGRLRARGAIITGPDGKN